MSQRQDRSVCLRATFALIPRVEVFETLGGAGARLLPLSADVAMAYTGFFLVLNALNGDRR